MLFFCGAVTRTFIQPQPLSRLLCDLGGWCGAARLVALLTVCTCVYLRALTVTALQLIFFPQKKV